MVLVFKSFVCHPKKHKILYIFWIIQIKLYDA